MIHGGEETNNSFYDWKLL